MAERTSSLAPVGGVASWHVSRRRRHGRLHLPRAPWAAGSADELAHLNRRRFDACGARRPPSPLGRGTFRRLWWETTPWRPVASGPHVSVTVITRSARDELSPTSTALS